MSDEFIGLVDTLHKSVCGSAPVSVYAMCVFVLGLVCQGLGLHLEVELIFSVNILYSVEQVTSKM